jgi:transcriptional regulator with XRE-family HTH domain
VPDVPDLMEASPESVRRLGLRLRAIRQAGGHSLAQVAEATGISRSFLSLVENGKNDLTVARLVRLVSFYGITVADLLDDAGSKRPEIVRRDDQHRIPSRSEKMDLYLLVHHGPRTMTPVLATYAPGGGTHEYLSYDSDQFDYVLEGTLAVLFEDEEPILLNEGDCAYYTARRRHKYRNAGERQARVLHVRSPGN